ncbi:MAG TPA: 3-hydroxybutyryl-CoA dehydrogenase [Burkholderiales bacterium]
MKITCVGAGRMGRGIALAFTLAGREVTLVDLKPRADFERLKAEAMQEMEASLAMLVELGAIPRVDMSGIRVVQGGEALRDADLIFEAVPETLEAKREAFAHICGVCAQTAILASTTSTILVTDLVPLVTHPQRLLNAHWLNPAYLIPLVEISVHPGTDKAVIEKLKALLEEAGKVPVVCGPTPGFIVPRLQALVMNEAARMVEEGAASAEDIDKATRYGLGLRFSAIGVVEFIDYGGNDILYYASRYLAEQVSAERYTAPEIVQRLMREGHLGLKTGQGFYDYRGRDGRAYRKDVLARTLAALEAFKRRRQA